MTTTEIDLCTAFLVFVAFVEYGKAGFRSVDENTDLPFWPLPVLGLLFVYLLIEAAFWPQMEAAVGPWLPW